MAKIIRYVSLSFTAGVIGALVNSLAAWLLGLSGLTALAGVKLSPSLSAPWLYPRLFWGGLWGLLLLMPFYKRSLVLRGVLLSFPPTLFQLLYMFPVVSQKGLLGIQLGLLTPLLVILLNILWGVTAALWYRQGEENTSFGISGPRSHSILSRRLL